MKDEALLAWEQELYVKLQRLAEIDALRIERALDLKGLTEQQEIVNGIISLQETTDQSNEIIFWITKEFHEKIYGLQGWMRWYQSVNTKLRNWFEQAFPRYRRREAHIIEKLKNFLELHDKTLLDLTLLRKKEAYLLEKLVKNLPKLETRLSLYRRNKIYRLMLKERGLIIGMQKYEQYNSLLIEEIIRLVRFFRSGKVLTKETAIAVFTPVPIPLISVWAPMIIYTIFLTLYSRTKGYDKLKKYRLGK